MTGKKFKGKEAGALVDCMELEAVIVRSCLGSALFWI